MPRIAASKRPSRPLIEIRAARRRDAPKILAFIRALAAYERLSHEVVADEAALRKALFGKRRAAEVLIGRLDGTDAGFAVFFQSFSTFLGRPGLFLEDLFVEPKYRGRGLGRALLLKLARIARERGCGRLEWNVLDWNDDARRFYVGLGATEKKEWRLFRVAGSALTRLGTMHG